MECIPLAPIKSLFSILGHWNNYFHTDSVWLEDQEEGLQTNELISCGPPVPALEQLELLVWSNLFPHKWSSKIPDPNSCPREKVRGRRWGRRQSFVSILVGTGHEVSSCFQNPHISFIAPGLFLIAIAAGAWVGKCWGGLEMLCSLPEKKLMSVHVHTHIYVGFCSKNTKNNLPQCTLLFKSYLLYPLLMQRF